MLTPEKRTPEVEYTLFKELRQELNSVTVVMMPWRVMVLVTHGVVQSQWPSCNLGGDNTAQLCGSSREALWHG
jgi:hypothetical protein